MPPQILALVGAGLLIAYLLKGSTSDESNRKNAGGGDGNNRGGESSTNSTGSSRGQGGIAQIPTAQIPVKQTTITEYQNDAIGQPNSNGSRVSEIRGSQSGDDFSGESSSNASGNSETEQLTEQSTNVPKNDSNGGSGDNG